MGEYANREPVDESAVLAALLGESKERLLELKEQLLECRRELLVKDQIILKLEAELVRGESESIMRRYGLQDGDTVERDPETGGYYVARSGNDEGEG